MLAETQVREDAPGIEAMRELVQGDKLRCGDILLIHRKHKMVSRIIRAVTGGYWNHVAMVYGSECCTGCTNEWMIEATGGGVQIRRLEEYLAHPEVADIGIKRLEAEWFGREHKEHLGYLLVQEVGKKYDFRLVFKLLVYLLITRVLRFLRLSFLVPFASFFNILSRMTPQPVAHICSGLAQWGYCKMAVEDKGSGAGLCGVWEVKEKGSGVLKTVTPADMAESDTFSWKYLVKDGKVWEVGSNEEVRQILGLTPGALEKE